MLGFPILLIDGAAWRVVEGDVYVGEPFGRVMRERQIYGLAHDRYLVHGGMVVLVVQPFVPADVERPRRQSELCSQGHHDFLDAQKHVLANRKEVVPVVSRDISHEVDIKRGFAVAREPLAAIMGGHGASNGC